MKRYKTISLVAVALGGSLLPATAGNAIVNGGTVVGAGGVRGGAVSITVPGYGAGNPALVVTRATLPRNNAFSGVGLNRGGALGGDRNNGWSGRNRGCGNNGGSWGTFDTGYYPYNNANYLGLPPWYRLNYYTPTTEEIDNGTAYQNIPSSHAWRGYGVPDGYPGTTGYGMPASQTNAQQDVDFVVAVQRELRRRGFYNGIVNGISDAATRSAIRSFEASAGLPVTGVIGVPLLRTFGFF